MHLQLARARPTMHCIHLVISMSDFHRFYVYTEMTANSHFFGICILFSLYILIGVGTGGAGGGGRAPPIFYPRDFMHAAQIAAIAEYITFGPPKMELLPTPSALQEVRGDILHGGTFCMGEHPALRHRKR